MTAVPLRRRRRSTTPERRRLGRIRWSMTAFSALTTARCLIVFGIVAATVDSQSRHREADHALAITAGQLGATANWNGGFSFDQGAAGT